MKKITSKELLSISGGKDINDYYFEIVKPAVIGGGAAVGGLGGALAGTLIIYGLEGIVQVAPASMNALEKINKVSDSQLQAILNDPYGYPD